jgi:hypothetical protein
MTDASANELGHLGVHQLLGQQLQPIAQELGVGAVLSLVEQV